MACRERSLTVPSFTRSTSSSRRVDLRSQSSTLPSVKPGHSYVAELSIEEDLGNFEGEPPVDRSKQKPSVGAEHAVYLQTALLHTTAYGERRIRVFTLDSEGTKACVGNMTDIEFSMREVCDSRK